MGDGDGAGAGFFRSSLRRASCSKTSLSVVFAKLGGPVTRAELGGVGAGGAWTGGAADTGGAEGARGPAEGGGVGAIGLVELGRIVHASSSNLLTIGTVELDRGGGCTGVPAETGAGESVRWI